MNNILMKPNTYRLPASWEPRDAVVLNWPNPQMLEKTEDLQELYEALVTVLIDYVDVIIATDSHEFADLRERLILMEVPVEYVYFYQVPSSSISIGNEGSILVEANSDFVILNRQHPIIESLYTQQAFPFAKLQQSDIQLSSADMESDGLQNLVVNLAALALKNANYSKAEIQHYIREKFSHEQIVWVDACGDHTFARVVPGNQCLYLACDDSQSEYYELLQKEKDNLSLQMDKLKQPMNLIPLPWGGVIEDDNGVECLVDYSQFIVVNEAVLVPLFDVPSDEDAMEILSQVFPGFEILGFPSMVLAGIKSSLLKITLSVVEGVLEPL
jgi:agmatine deiminase